MASDDTDYVGEILIEGELNMKSALQVLQSNLNSIRAGRARPEMLDPITVTVYDGKKMSLKDLATISAPEARLLTLTVWDLQNVDIIVKALRDSNYHFNPQVNGTLIRIVIPHLTEERRLELGKQAKRYTDHCKVALRNVRKKCSDNLKVLQKEKHISEDMVKQVMNKQVQKMLDKMMVEAEGKLEEKTKDILTV
ncbi:ribosome-recycling factor-like [Homalodisca vitripennis]|uniref:ribosome-recycling factor-like n=1 Tax=Homalodisca vitripennis TaxID=197043 RepID=UPI001EEA4CAE|nr:ribosome-recycling factor-like [Homalodisca vitripennis]